MATHSSMPAWEIPRTEEPGGLQCMESDMTEPPSMHTQNQSHVNVWQKPPQYCKVISLQLKKINKNKKVQKKKVTLYTSVFLHCTYHVDGPYVLVYYPTGT